MKRTAPILFILAFALSALSACGSDDEATPAPSDTPSATAAPGVVSPKLPVAPAFTNPAKGVIKDVKVTDCPTTTPGTVKATGTATNSGKFTRSIVITVSWARPGTSDVVGRGIAVLRDLAPGKSADWSASATLSGTDTVQCIPTAVAGQLKKKA